MLQVPVRLAVIAACHRITTSNTLPSHLPTPSESQRKVPLDLVVAEEDSPYDVGPSKDYQRQQELLCE